MQPMHNVQMKYQHKTAKGELNREALKIYLDDVLTLECIKNKLSIDLKKATQNSLNIKKQNYLKRYVISKFDYSDGTSSSQYVHLFFDGSSYYIAMEQEYLNKKVCTGESLLGAYEFVSITDRTIRSVAKWSKWATFSDKRNYTKGLLEAYSDFKETALRAYQENINKASSMTQTANRISYELDKACNLLQKAYQVNIIPMQFRNLYTIYYLHEFISTSRESLSAALLHCDLNEIKAKLDKIIAQQQEVIIQQAIIASQNNQLLQQNKLQLERLASIESNTTQAGQYAEIAAVNAETCAWIGLANYIDKRI